MIESVLKHNRVEKMKCEIYSVDFKKVEILYSNQIKKSQLI